MDDYISMKRSSSQGKVSRKTATGCEQCQSVERKRKSAFGQGQIWPKPLQ